MTEFISYASEYDLYVGRRSIGELTAPEQDELITSILASDGDFRKLAVRKEIKKSQAEGVWALIVFTGLALEEARRIKNFETRDDQDVQEIVAFFSGTKLWLRLEEAYPPFDFLEKKTDYDWSELEKIRIELLTEATGEPLYRVKSKICEYFENGDAHNFSRPARGKLCASPFSIFQSLIFGPSQSRSESPKRLKANTPRLIAIPGKTIIHGACW